MTESKNIKYKFQGKGLSTAEKKIAKKRFDKYLKSYPGIDNLSDFQLLENLIFREIIQEKYKEKIGFLTKNKAVEDAQIIPKHLMTSLNENEEQILILKEKLGLFKEKNIDDPYKQHELLEKKFEIYRKEHPEEFKTTCPFCSEVFFLNIRTDKYTESKLKLYKNKVLCNEHLWKCYKEGKITKDDMASILNTSPDYVDWLEEKIYDKESEVNLTEAKTLDSDK
jgi:hypothetical protein